jgi:hypothetical protein
MAGKKGQMEAAEKGAGKQKTKCLFADVGI